MFERYAIYHTPRGDLADFGARWLGWDMEQAVVRDHPVVAGLDVGSLTETPRKYGLHATVKPPFRLADGCTVDVLKQRVADLCAGLPAVALEGLELSAIGRFLALTPVGETASLGDLAGQVVRELDRFRAPPSEAELARRRQADLTPAQERNLRDWGYPYVMDAFRFHITLTGKLDEDMLARTRAALEPRLAPILLSPFRVDSLTLAGQRADGMFVTLHRYALTG